MHGLVLVNTNVSYFLSSFLYHTFLQVMLYSTLSCEILGLITMTYSLFGHGLVLVYTSHV